LIMVMAVYLFTYAIGLFSTGGVKDNLRRMSGDFVQYYAVSELALAGRADKAYDHAELYVKEESVKGVKTTLPWHYPPGFMLIIQPLARLPYEASYLLWQALGLIGGALIIRRIAPGRLPFLLFLAFPGTYLNLLFGQNGFLSLIFLGGGLIAAERRPFVGGLILGLLSYKPHLAVLVPASLLVARDYRTLLGMITGGLSLALLSLIVFGSEVWLAFFENIPFALKALESGAVPLAQMPTPTAALLMAGVGSGLVRLIQGLISLTALTSVLWVFYRPGDLPGRGPVLTLAALLTTPHALVYDLVLLALPLAWLGRREMVRRPRPWLIFLLAAGWVLPLAAFGLAKAFGIQIGPVVLIALFAAALSQAGNSNGPRGQAAD
ncbi:MAG: DUF2029 domain-containing protein, partial [Chlorobiales bacterium]|nr:DUF2029 domain-containing protein [Chlorobiales bacterium]